MRTFVEHTGMRFDRDKLLNLALATLAQVVAESGADAIPPRVAIRLALLTVYSLGGGAEPMREFWQGMIDTMEREHSDVIRATIRRLKLNGALIGMARNAGLEMNPGLHASLHRLWDDYVIPGRGGEM